MALASGTECRYLIPMQASRLIVPPFLYTLSIEPDSIHLSRRIIVIKRFFVRSFSRVKDKPFQNKKPSVIAEGSKI
jgi:hypothetical protein